MNVPGVFAVASSCVPEKHRAKGNICRARPGDDRRGRKDQERDCCRRGRVVHAIGRGERDRERVAVTAAQDRAGGRRVDERAGNRGGRIKLRTESGVP